MLDTSINKTQCFTTTRYRQATTSHVFFPATMETELLQSTVLKSGTQPSHHAQIMQRIMQCNGCTVEKKKKKRLNFSFLMTNLMFVKKLHHLSMLKTRHAWKRPEVSPGRGGEKKNMRHTKGISHVLIPLFPSGTNEVINQSHGPIERGKRGPEAYREGGWGGQKHPENQIVLQKKCRTAHNI